MAEHEEYVLALHLLRRLRAGWLPHRVGGKDGSWYWGRPMAPEADRG